MIIAGPQTFEQPIDCRQERVGIPVHTRNCIALPFIQRRLLIPFQALAQSDDYIKRRSQFMRHLSDKLRTGAVFLYDALIKADAIVWDVQFAVHIRLVHAAESRSVRHSALPSEFREARRLLRQVVLA